MVDRFIQTQISNYIGTVNLFSMLCPGQESPILDLADKILQRQIEYHIDKTSGLESIHTVAALVKNSFKEAATTGTIIDVLAFTEEGNPGTFAISVEFLRAKPRLIKFRKNGWYQGQWDNAFHSLRQEYKNVVVNQKTYKDF